MRQRLPSVTGLPTVVTGASSGIGRSLALELARRGARVALLARRERELAEVSDEIARSGGDSLIVPCDITNHREIAEAAEFVESHLGVVELLVNNAGIGSHQRFLDLEIGELERTLQVNLVGAAAVTKAFLPSMVSRGRGWLVFVASVAGRVSTPSESAYVASKAGLIGLAESLSLEVEDTGIHVLTVCPGIVRTPFFGHEGPPNVNSRWSVQVEPEDLSLAILRSLAKGHRRLTFPRKISASYLAQVIAPEWTRRQVERAARRES